MRTEVELGSHCRSDCSSQHLVPWTLSLQFCSAQLLKEPVVQLLCTGEVPTSIVLRVVVGLSCFCGSQRLGRAISPSKERNNLRKTIGIPLVSRGGPVLTVRWRWRRRRWLVASPGAYSRQDIKLRPLESFSARP